MVTKKSKAVVEKSSPKKTKKSTNKTSEVKYPLELSVGEITLIRDLLSMMLPPDGEYTVASVLSQVTESAEHEKTLWTKIWDACVATGVPVGEDAPDYLVAQTMSLGVYQVSKQEE